MISEKQWDVFFEIMAEITNEEGAWDEKKRKVEDMALKMDADLTLEEFVGWWNN